MEVFVFLPFICADLNDFTVFLQYYITLMGIIIENYVQMHYGNESLGLNVINYHENVTSQTILMFLKSDWFSYFFWFGGGLWAVRISWDEPVCF